MDKIRINQLKEQITNKTIVIIGDLMLDGYFRGDVKRVSPEAPVPVVEVDNEFFRFGGAANVALNIHELGGIPIPIGVIGNDNDGQIFQRLINDLNISNEGIFIDENRPTTTKTRVIASSQHVVRIDKESKDNVNNILEEKIINFLKSTIDKVDAIILQDYNKGVLTDKIISESISISNSHNIIISVDPKFINFKKYQNVTVFKPNKRESENILGVRIESDKDISKAGNDLLQLMNARYVLLTLGEKGIALFEKDNREIRIPTKARKVADVSGAGDTVISTITFTLCSGASIEEAAYIANYAGGLVCEEVGIVPISKEKLFNALLNII